MSQPIPMIVGGEKDRTHCPTCGMAVRVVRRVYDDEADHYEALIGGEDVSKVLAPQYPETAAKLRELRKGKKTVAIVGLAATSCSLAPFDEEGVEIWGLNEAHAFPQWFKRADRWVQIHATDSWKRYIAMLEKFERIEIYGFEMADDEEWVHQKACAEFWIGYAMGKGIEIYTPPNCQILYSALYGGSEQGAGW